MKLYLLCLFSLLLLLGCKKEAPGPTQTFSDSDVMPAEGIRYLALGDSYTIGHGVEAAGRYPVQLSAALEANNVAVEETKIIAATGWTTANLKEAIAQAKLTHSNWDLVTLLIGVNNQYQGRSLEEYRLEFEELLQQAIQLAGGDNSKVIVLSIPDYGYTPFGESQQAQISAEIDKFNAVNKEITLALGVSYIDITPISRQGLADPELVAGDGLHPSEKMYGQWVTQMLDVVLDKVK